MSCDFQAVELQSKIENAGGEKLKAQKLKVEKIQSVSCTLLTLHISILALCGAYFKSYNPLRILTNKALRSTVTKFK